jgi:hypothetical protein
LDGLFLKLIHYRRSKAGIIQKDSKSNTFYEGEFGNIITMSQPEHQSQHSGNDTLHDRFRDYASKEAGVYLPQPSDLYHVANENSN